MKKEITDEQIDQLLRQVFVDAAVNNEEVEAIADSPQLWWAVQREIAARKAPRSMPWPPVANWLRVIGFAVPVSAAVIIAILTFAFRLTSNVTEQAGLRQNDLPQTSIIASEEPSELAARSTNTVNVTSPTRSATTPGKATRRSQSLSAVGKARPAVTSTQAVTDKVDEIKTDFIALSYARNPESGQIVRVRVPSSMKVQLGIASSVDNPSDLVDAEVIVGDDGLTRAIRFIR